MINDNLISFAELEIPKNCNITEEAIRHSGMAGSVFNLRGQALEALEVAKDSVKEVRARLSLAMRQRGNIPNPTEENSQGTIKLTEGALKDYVDAHPEMIEARNNRAKAEKYYDDVKAIVTAYNARKDLLVMIGSDRKNEFYSTPKDGDLSKYEN